MTTNLEWIIVIIFKRLLLQVECKRVILYPFQWISFPQALSIWLFYEFISTADKLELPFACIQRKVFFGISSEEMRKVSCFIFHIRKDDDGITLLILKSSIKVNVIQLNGEHESRCWASSLRSIVRQIKTFDSMKEKISNHEIFSGGIQKKVPDPTIRAGKLLWIKFSLFLGTYHSRILQKMSNFANFSFFCSKIVSPKHFSCRYWYWIKSP